MSSKKRNRIFRPNAYQITYQCHFTFLGWQCNSLVIFPVSSSHLDIQLHVGPHLPFEGKHYHSVFFVSYTETEMSFWRHFRSRMQRKLSFHCDKIFITCCTGSFHFMTNPVQPKMKISSKWCISFQCIKPQFHTIYIWWRIMKEIM